MNMRTEHSNIYSRLGTAMSACGSSANHYHRRRYVGLVGYERWQTTAKTGPTISPALATAHYSVNAIGFVSNLFFPSRKVNFKYFKEFSNKSTFQGYSLQISGGITF